MAHIELIARGDGVAVINLIFGGEADGDFERRDVSLGRFNEYEIVVVDIFASKELCFVAFCCDGLACADVLGVEIVNKCGVVERDFITVDDIAHIKLIAYGDGVAVINLIFGGEADGDFKRRDGGDRCVHECDVVVLKIRAGEHGFVIACCGHGLIRTDVLGIEVVFDGGVVELDVVAFDHIVHEKSGTIGCCIAVVDLVVGGEADVDFPRRDLRQSHVIERHVVVMELVAT